MPLSQVAVVVAVVLVSDDKVAQRSLVTAGRPDVQRVFGITGTPTSRDRGRRGSLDSGRRAGRFSLDDGRSFDRGRRLFRCEMVDPETERFEQGLVLPDDPLALQLVSVFDVHDRCGIMRYARSTSRGVNVWVDAGQLIL